jgi:hypothetical protein
MSNPKFQGPGVAAENAALPYYSGDPDSSGTIERKRQATLMAIDGVEGVGTGQNAIGNEGIVVYVRDAEAAKRIPKSMDGLDIHVEVTGPISALNR